MALSISSATPQYHRFDEYLICIKLTLVQWQGQVQAELLYVAASYFTKLTITDVEAGSSIYSILTADGMASYLMQAYNASIVGSPILTSKATNTSNLAIGVLIL